MIRDDENELGRGVGEGTQASHHPNDVEFDLEMDDFPPHEPIMQPFEEDYERDMREPKAREEVVWIICFCFPVF